MREYIQIISFSQKDEGWGPEPTNPPFPWNESPEVKKETCDLCYAGFCKENNHIGWGINYWSWDDVHSDLYLWCYFCFKDNHNTYDCKFKKAIETEKEKFKCAKCSAKYRPKYHYKGEKCRCFEWNNGWTNNFVEIRF
ncbi:23478_t:CDS:2 [Gigaspora rosea]|nr:23478_t:CDS:2 [Gigaspora rosea]